MIRRLAWPRPSLGSRRRWAAVLGVALLLRVALPYALRPVLEAQASRAVDARVEIGDVDLALYRAGIALEDVAVHPAGPAPAATSGEPPLIAWKRLAVAVRWLPLLWKTIQLRELVLDSPSVAIDRLQDGGFNLMTLARGATGEPADNPPAPGEPAGPAAEEQSGWGFGIDRVELRDGGIRFRDLMFARIEPVELSLGSFEVEEIALTPSVYGAPAHVHLEARVDDGRLVLDASLTPHDDGGFALTSHLKARRLPLRRTRVYVPRVGWSDLQGEFGGALDYTLETGGRNEVRGQVTVDGLTVRTPRFEGVGLAWKRLAVLVDPIDLAGRRAVVRRVDLDGSYLVARARGGVVFPFIEEVLTGEPAVGNEEPAGTEGDATPPAPGADEPPPPEPPPAAPPPPAPPAAPPPPPPAPAPAPPTPVAGAPVWQWSVDVARVWDSLLHVISPDASFDVGCTMTVRHLRSEGSDPASVSLALGVGDGGAISVEGKTRIQPVGFDGQVKVSQVPLPDVVATIGAFPPGVVQRARLEADLAVTAGALATTPGDVRVEGTIAFDEPYLVGAGGATTEFGAKRVAFGMQELVVPGGLAEQPPTTAADARLRGGTVSLQDMWAVRTQPTAFDVRAASLEAALDELTAPGVGPPPADGSSLRLRGTMRVADVFAGNGGGSGLDIGMRRVDVEVGEFVLPGILATDPALVTAPMRLAGGAVMVTEPSATGSGPRKLDARARGIEVEIDELLAPGRGALGVHLRGGRLAVAAPAVAGADAKEFAVGARSIGVGVDEIALPGTVPTRVRIRDITLAAPRVQLTRTAQGLKLPAFGGDGAAPPPAVTTTPTSATSPEPEARPAHVVVAATLPPGAPSAGATAPGAARTLDLVVDRVRLTDGRIGVIDQTVKPFYTGGVGPLQIDLAGLRWPALAMDRLRVEATSAQKGQITITGTLTPTGGKVQVDGKDIPLKQFNPYAISLSPYSIKKGRLSVATKATFGQERYDSESQLTLHDFDLGSKADDSLFKEQFGIPLAMALALLRDLQGDIKLDIPVEGDEQGMRVGYMAIIAGALRRALVNAIASPLKLVGAIVSGDKVQAAPAPIAFRTGRDVPSDEGEAQLDQLAKFLAERPAMGVALQTAPTNADVRWLHEHDLLQELGAPQGVFGTLRHITTRGERDRIREALAARADGKAGELDAEDQKTLEAWLAERPAPAPERVRELAGARLTRVEKSLREAHRIAAARIVRRDLPAEPAAEAPTVDVELGSVADLQAPPEDSEPASPVTAE